MRCGRRALAARERGQARALRRHRRRPLQADRAARGGARPALRGRGRARPGRQGQGAGVGRRRARRARHPDLRGERANDRPRDRAARLDHGARLLRPRQGGDERRPREGRRYLRRVDHRRARASASGGWSSDDEAMSDIALPAARAGARAGRARRQGHRPDRSSRRSRPDMAFPATAAHRRRPARQRRRGRLRPLGRLHGLHVRARAGARDGRGRPREARARDRRRRPLEGPRLDRPLDARPLRRRRGRGRARARRRGRLPRLRARRRRRRAPTSCNFPGSGSRAVARRHRGLPADERPRGLQVRDPRARAARPRQSPGRM